MVLKHHGFILSLTVTDDWYCVFILCNVCNDLFVYPTLYVSAPLWEKGDFEFSSNQPIMKLQNFFVVIQVLKVIHDVVHGNRAALLGVGRKDERPLCQSMSPSHLLYKCCLSGVYELLEE